MLFFGWLKNKSGSNLPNTLLVAGIMVALAVAIGTQTITFNGEVYEGQENTELLSIQTALDNMMVERGLIRVTPNEGVSSSGYRDWDNVTSPFGRGSINLGPNQGGYISTTSSDWAYCWNMQGRITKQLDSGGDCD